MSNQDIIRGLYQAFADGDIASVLGAMAADIVWTEAENHIYADGNPYRGPDAILSGVFARLGSEWSGYAATPERFFSDGDTVIVLGRYSGVYNETGRSLNAQFVHVWTLADQRIKRFEQFSDTLQFRAAQLKAAAI